MNKNTVRKCWSNYPTGGRDFFLLLFVLNTNSIYVMRKPSAWLNTLVAIRASLVVL